MKNLAIPRIHLVELHDLNICPAAVREGVTDHLHYSDKIFKIYDPAVSILAEALKRSKAQRVVDLCSGGSGPWIRLRKELATLIDQKVEVQLSDKYPNRGAIERVNRSQPGLAYIKQSVDATCVPTNIKGFRTIFSGFHHFSEPVAKSIIKDAVDKGEGIAVFEYTERSALGIINCIFGALSSFLLVPFFRPFKWSRLFFTYLIPLIPLLLFIDGIVSCLRTYSPDELKGMTKEHHNYRWETGRRRVSGQLLWVTYLIGTPKSPNDENRTD